MINQKVFEPVFIDKISEVLFSNARYKVLYGGRGSGKTIAAADYILLNTCYSKKLVLCTREFQTSIRDSVHRVLVKRISELGLDDYFEIQQNVIYSKAGSEIIFKGLQRNASEIKSTEGVDICFLEEAERTSRDSLSILIPTIRKKGSEFIIVFNPDDIKSPIYQDFILNPPKNCKSTLVNYCDNPFFPDTELVAEMEWDKKNDFAKYENIWLGKLKQFSDALIFKGKYRVEDFITEELKPERFFYGADWGFACLKGDTLVSTIKGNVAIKDIKIGDKVLTREGYKKVLDSRSKGIKKVYEFDFGYRKNIIVTGDHRIFTNDGWKRVDELKEVETLCLKKLNLIGKFIRGILKVNILIISIIKQVEEKTHINKFCIEIFGNFIMVKLKKAISFIIKMAILLIIKLKILFVLLLKSILKYIIRKIWVLYQKMKCQKLEQTMDTQKKIGQAEDLNLYKLLKIRDVFVWSVEILLMLKMFIKNIVILIVEKKQIVVLVKKNIYAKIVALNLWLLHMMKESHVLKTVHINLQLLKEKIEVFDITVENGEFFANGLLVHNCDPSVLIRSFIVDKKLYIDYAEHGYHTELDDLPALFSKVPDYQKNTIYADCSRPETISHLRNKNIDVLAAKKWAGSVEDGIAYLKNFEEIVVHPRCKYFIDECGLYCYKKDSKTDEILSIIVDKHNHGWDALRYAHEKYITAKNGGVMIF